MVWLKILVFVLSLLVLQGPRQRRNLTQPTAAKEIRQERPVKSARHKLTPEESKKLDDEKDPSPPAEEAEPKKKSKVHNALAEVNRARARRGLPPYAFDEKLTEAAKRCAAYRAKRRIAGHTGNDFAFLPKGGRATAAGCGALDDSWGWGSCCTYESWRKAGAAWVRGSDGKRYMHLFVR